MKWQNKGHEYDEEAADLLKRYDESGKKIWVFGAGLLGASWRALFEDPVYDCFAGYIDNDSDKQKNGKDGAKVISLDTYLAQSVRGLIVVAADARNIPNIVKQLEEAGLVAEQDFYTYSQFDVRIFPILSFYVHNRLYAYQVALSVTNRCTLRCKYCMRACHNVDRNEEDMNIDMAKHSVDAFFAQVDRIGTFDLTGGEPLLYENIDELIEYAGEKYRTRMSHMQIFTNGTIIPSVTTLELCNKYNIKLCISNYSGTLPQLKHQYDKLCDILTEHDISFFLIDRTSELWFDRKTGRINRQAYAAELIKIFDECGILCKEIRGSKLYYCAAARSTSDNLHLGIGTEDYLDLSMEQNKAVILEFLMGYSEKGYLDMCNHCLGNDKKLPRIPAAEQVE